MCLYSTCQGFSSGPPPLLFCALAMADQERGNGRDQLRPSEMSDTDKDTLRRAGGNVISSVQSRRGFDHHLKRISMENLEYKPMNSMNRNSSLYKSKANGNAPFRPESTGHSNHSQRAFGNVHRNSADMQHSDVFGNDLRSRKLSKHPDNHSLYEKKFPTRIGTSDLVYNNKNLVKDDTFEFSASRLSSQRTLTSRHDNSTLNNFTIKPIDNASDSENILKSKKDNLLPVNGQSKLISDKAVLNRKVFDISIIPESPQITENVIDSEKLSAVRDCASSESLVDRINPTIPNSHVLQSDNENSFFSNLKSKCFASCPETDIHSSPTPLVPRQTVLKRDFQLKSHIINEISADSDSVIEREEIETNLNNWKLSSYQMGTKVLSKEGLTYEIRFTDECLRIISLVSFSNRFIASHDIRYDCIDNCYYYLSSDNSFLDVRLNIVPQFMGKIISKTDLDCRLVRFSFEMDLGSHGDFKNELQRVFQSKLELLSKYHSYSPSFIPNRSAPNPDFRDLFKTPVRTYGLRSATLFTRTSPSSFSTTASTPTYDRISIACAPSAIPRLSENPDILFMYPPSSFDAVAITSNELKRLPRGVFLNDSLIEFNMRYILDNIQTESGLRKKIHLFSSFFYKKLEALELKSNDGGDQQGTFRPMSRVDIFTKKYIFIPINEASHWYLALIFNANALIRNNEVQTKEHSASQGGDDEDTPIVIDEPTPSRCTIYIFDSLGAGMRKGAIDRLKLFLINDAMSRHQIIVNKRSIHSDYPKLPLQPNHTDCGCFLIEYFERFVQDHNVVMMHLKQKHDMTTWFSSEDAADRRIKLKSLIHHLSKVKDDVVHFDCEIHPSNSSDVEEIVNINH